MRIVRLALLVGAFSAFVAPPAAAEPEPPSGIGGIVTGSILLGVGAANLASTGICFLPEYRDLVGEDAANVCTVSSLLIGGGLTIAGVPVLLHGLKTRRAHQAWEAADPDLTLHLGGTIGPDGGRLVLSGRF